MPDIKEVLGAFIHQCEEQRRMYPPASPIIIVPESLYRAHRDEIDAIARHYDAAIVIREAIPYKPEVNLTAIVERLKKKKFYA